MNFPLVVERVHSLRARHFAYAFAVSAICLCAQIKQTASKKSDLGLAAESPAVAVALVPDANGRIYSASFRNLTTRAIFLVLGAIVANDRELCPNRVELVIEGPDGKTHHTHSDLRCGTGVVAGRLDPMIVPLAAAAVYSLPVLSLEAMPLGRYSLKAKYTGVAPPLRTLNSDVQGLSLIHYWTGTVESKSVTTIVR